MYVLNCFVIMYLPSFNVEDSSIRHWMEKRPIGSVAASVVEEIKELRVHADRHGLVGLEPGGGGDVIRKWFRNFVDFRIEVGQAGPAHPDALAVDDHWSNGRYQATGAKLKSIVQIYSRLKRIIPYLAFLVRLPSSSLLSTNGSRLETTIRDEGSLFFGVVPPISVGQRK